MQLKRYLIIPLLLLGIGFGSSSCYEHYHYEADLLVSVQGLLSGNPRAGLPVQIFETAYDAENLIYPITPVVYTDEFGEIVVYGLEPGYDYYVRVDALLSTKIKSTGHLHEGANRITFRFL